MKKSAVDITYSDGNGGDALSDGVLYTDRAGGSGSAENPLGRIETDARGIIVSADRIVARILGRSAARLKGTALDSMFDGSRCSGGREPGRKKGRGASGLLREVAIRRPDGATVFCLTGVLTTGEARTGNQTHLLIDITARRREEQELRRSRDHLYQALRKSPDLIYRLDRDGRIVFASDAFNGYGYDSRELPGRHILELVHPEDRKIAARKIAERRTGERMTRFLEVRLLPGPGLSGELKDEERVLLISAEGHYTTHQSDGSLFAGTQGVAKDITERKKWERELQANRSELAAIFDSAPMLMALVDESMRLRKINRAGTESLGRPEQELLGRPWGEAFGCLPCTDDGTSCDSSETCGQCPVGRAIRQAIETGTPCSRIEAHTTVVRDGEQKELYLFVSASGLDLAGRRMALLCLEDITERRHIEEQLQLRQRMDSLGTLAGGIAHDFNNLLTGIMGNISILSLNPLNLSEIHRQCITDAERSCRRASELIRQFQNLSSGAVAEKRTVDLHEIVTEVFAILGQTTDRLVEKRVDFPAGQFFVRANPAELTQVFLNLGTNAAQAIEEKGPAEGDLIRVQAAPCSLGDDDPSGMTPGEYVLVTFSDTGAGMTPEVQRRAFDPLFTTRSESHKGQGLGLSMVYNIVTRKYAGRVDMESAPGRGTTFHVLLPAVQAALTDDSLAQSELPRGDETVLVIDDEPVVLDFASLTLRSLGYTVLTATDGRSGLDLFRANQGGIDLILLDLVMPKLSGVKVFEEIAARDCEVRVVISSGQSNEYVQENIHSRTAGFLSKPYKAEELARTVRRALDA